MIIGRGFIASELKRQALPNATYYFTGVSSNSLLMADFDALVKKEISQFVEAISKADYFIYASSSLAKNPVTPYGKLKHALEHIAQVYPILTLGIRLPVVYGPQELHKGVAASVVYKWTQQMKDGESPIIFGDGTQTRDFMYIDDAVEVIGNLAAKEVTGIANVGTGINTSFNEVVATISRVVGREIEPTYIEKPQEYANSITADTLFCKVPLEEGIAKLL